MTPRPRKKSNAALPPNLYQSKVNGAVYFTYKHPITNKRHGMGRDKAKAIAAAKQLNSILITNNDLVSKVKGLETIAQHIKWFKREIMPKRKYADKTAEMYETKFNQLKDGLGEDTPLEQISVTDISDLMAKLSDRSAQQLRQVGVDLFKTAIGRGFIEQNPAEQTNKPILGETIRQRLTMEQFEAIHKAAPLWLRNAMDLALITLQRREDIVSMKFDQIKDGALYVIQEKTKKHDTGYLKIAMGDSLSEVVARCRDDVASPFLIHRMPERKIKREGMHWTQIKPEFVTRAFKEITDELKVFKSIKREARPTFHEIRALGIKTYKDRGFDPQQLAGHATAKMTKNYDSGHDEIRWIEAETL